MEILLMFIECSMEERGIVTCSNGKHSSNSFGKFKVLPLKIKQQQQTKSKHKDLH